MREQEKGNRKTTKKKGQKNIKMVDKKLAQIIKEK
jgi:hypothetical protein